MRFKLWLNEARYHDLISWLSPQGEFVPVKRYHFDEAFDIVKRYPEKSTTIKNAAEARDFLFEKGWMRITHNNRILFANNPVASPNKTQLSELKDLAIIRDHIQEIVYDNDVTERTLWNRDDV